jgi:hypothetical protein
LEGIRLSNELKIIPNDADLVLRIESEFKYDRLYNLIIERDQLKSELLNNEFISLLEEDIHKWYSVSDAGKVIGGDKPVPPSSLTYYIDSLREYIIPEDAPTNKYIRLNYLSLIKLKMVLLLKDEFRLNGLKAELGITANPKHVITNNRSNVPSTETDNDLNEMKKKLDEFEAMNKVLWGLLLEEGEDGKTRLKKPLQSLLSSETLLLQGESSILNKLEEQVEEIKKLRQENEHLKEKIEETSTQTSTINKKLEESEKDREKILESERKFNNLTETLRARQLAEGEWEGLGYFKKLKLNRSDYVEERTKAILEGRV